MASRQFSTLTSGKTNIVGILGITYVSLCQLTMSRANSYR